MRRVGNATEPAARICSKNSVAGYSEALTGKRRQPEATSRGKHHGNVAGSLGMRGVRSRAGRGCRCGSCRGPAAPTAPGRCDAPGPSRTRDPGLRRWFIDAARGPGARGNPAARVGLPRCRRFSRAASTAVAAFGRIARGGIARRFHDVRLVSDPHPASDVSGPGPTSQSSARPGTFALNPSAHSMLSSTVLSPNTCVTRATSSLPSAWTSSMRLPPVGRPGAVGALGP